MLVVCNKKDKCKHRHECGGAKPHVFDENECNKCPMDKNAECVVCVEEEHPDGPNPDWLGGKDEILNK
jgi:hypothetical protein